MEVKTTTAAALMVYGDGGPAGWALFPPGPDRPSPKRVAGSRDWFTAVVNRAGEAFFFPIPLVLDLRIARQPGDREYLARVQAMGDALPESQIATENIQSEIQKVESATRELEDEVAFAHAVRADTEKAVMEAPAVFAAGAGRVMGAAASFVGMVAGEAAKGAFIGLGPVGITITLCAVGFIAYRLVR